MRQRTCPGGTNTTCIRNTKTNLSNKRKTAKKKVLIKMSDSQVLFRLLFVVVSLLSLLLLLLLLLQTLSNVPLPGASSNTIGVEFSLELSSYDRTSADRSIGSR
jgi:hypothetical protein